MVLKNSIIFSWFFRIFFIIVYLLFIGISTSTLNVAYAKSKKGSFHKYTLTPEVKSVRIQLSTGTHLELRPLKIQKPSKKQQKKTAVDRRELMVWMSHSPILWRNPLTHQIKEGVFILSDKQFYSTKNILGKQNKQAIRLVIEAPQIPLQIIAFGGGQIKVADLKNIQLLVSAQNRESIHIQNTQGNLTIFQGTGSARVESHIGQLIAQGENAHIHLQSCEGKMNLKYFKGSIHVEKSTGELDLRSFKAPSTIKKFTGKLNFHTEKGKTQLTHVSGSIFGFSKEGNIKGTLYPNEARIETNTGKIWLNMPKSDIWVNAESWEGKIRTPNYFHHIRTGGMDRASGRLRGTIQRKGSVSLKSQSGSISIYQTVK